MAKNNTKDVNEKNVEFEELTSTEGFFDKYKNILIYSVIGVVVVLIGFLGYNKFVQEPHEADSQEELVGAFYAFEADSLDMAVNGTDEFTGLADIADEYNGTSGGDIANYLSGKASMEKGEFDEALDYLSNCNFDDIIIATECIGLQGDCYVEKDDFEKAIELFNQAANRQANEFTTPMYLKKAGLVYEELKQYDKAVEVYTKIKNEYPRSIDGADIDKFIARAKK